MVKIGKISLLEVLRLTEPGAYLDGGPYGDILMPNRYVTENCGEGDDVEVFIYFDSEDRIVASTDFPYVMADEFGYLKVVEVTSFGAFLDWGLPKDLLVPFREQAQKMGKGKSYLVRVYVDNVTGRIVASSKINKFLSNEELLVQEGDEVELLIANRTDLGYNAIINGTYAGILYHNEIFKPISTGQKLSGFIKKIREDNKIDLSLEKQGYSKVDPVSGEILAQLKKTPQGYLPFNDKTEPELIQKKFAISKKTFKKAIGQLYKEKLILIEEEGIRLLINPDL
jgi:uncharacterized protein